MKHIWTVLVLLPLILPAQDLATNADALLSAYHQQDQFSGTVLIAKKGKILFSKAYGEADREKKIPNTTATEYRIGSVTKQFTAALILKLQEQKVLSVKDPLSKYIADYPKGDSVLVENLLNHTSGIKSITSMKQYYAEWIGQPSTLEQTVAKFKNEPYSFSPGKKFEYSNSNYILLSYITELATGKKFDKLMEQYIFKPLKLTNTGIDKNMRTSPLKALGYQASPENDYAIARYNDMSVLTGAGAMYSTAKDLYIWDRALYKNQLLSPASLEQMFSPNAFGYGFGWHIDTVKGRVEISHSGSIDGYKSNIIRYPAEDVCIVFLSNYFESKGPQISKALTAIAFDEAFEMPKQRKFVQLDAQQLQLWQGVYQMEKGPQVTVFLEDGVLKGKLEKQQPFKLLAESEKQFYIKPIDTEVLFNTDTEGNPIEMIFQQGKKTMRFKRV